MGLPAPHVREQDLFLNARSGDLRAELADYIHERTAGVTGEVMDLLRRGANKAITSGTERITREVLHDLPLSKLAPPKDAA